MFIIPLLAQCAQMPLGESPWLHCYCRKAGCPPSVQTRGFPGPQHQLTPQSSQIPVTQNKIKIISLDGHVFEFPVLTMH